MSRNRETTKSFEYGRGGVTEFGKCLETGKRPNPLNFTITYVSPYHHHHCYHLQHCHHHASALSIVAGITMVNMVNINIVIAIVTANTMATNHYQLQVDGRFSRLDLDARHHGGAHLCYQVGSLTNGNSIVYRNSKLWKIII